MKRSLVVVLMAFASISFLGACASHTHEIAPAYISPLEYDDYSCKQIKAEIARVSRRAQQVAGEVNKNADGDSTAMGVGLILFWPALFFIDGDSPQAQEYAELKGRFNTLEEVGIQKNCGIKVEKDPFAEVEQQRRAQQQQTRKTANE
jgi:hypothetical protein